MNKKPLEALFNAMYHGKLDFEDFSKGSVSARYQTKEIVNEVKRKRRVIHAPDKTLKSYHEFLNLFVFDYLEIDEKSVFSYRKGVNVINAVTLHSNARYFFQADLQNFFPSIKSEIVKETILKSSVYSPVADVDSYIDRIIELVTVDSCLPVGFSTSPVLSNAVLQPFDVAMTNYCSENTMAYTRYSDDIIISSAQKESLSNLSEIIEDNFKRLMIDLKLNQKKVKVTGVGQKVKLLGMVILPNGTISVDSKLKSYVETMLYLYTKDKAEFRKFVDLDAAKSSEKLSGYLNYINTVDQVYLDKLRHKYGVTVIDSLIYQSKK